MTISPESLRRLATLGLASEQMAVVLDIIAESVDKPKKSAASERQKRYRDRNALHNVVTSHVTSRVMSQNSLVPPLDGFPHPSLETSLNPSKLKIPKISLDELSVTHISQWLSEKRHSGKYLDHDPVFILEKFKNYCQAKGKKYTDYVAAYRNAFDWESVQPKIAKTSPQQTSKWSDNV